MMMAGPLHPPFSLFIPRIKRENGPCTVQKRKTRGRGLRGRGSGSGGLVRKSSDRSVVQAGVLFLAEWTSFSFCCRTPAFPLELRLPLSLSVSTASAAAESAAGPFADIQTPAKTEPRAGGFRKNRKHCLRASRPTVRIPYYFFFSFGPCTARFLFFFWKKKRKWGVQCTSHLHG